MIDLFSKLHNIFDAAVSILDPRFGYSMEVIVEEDNPASSYPYTATPITNNKEILFKEIYGHENTKLF